MTQTPEGGTIKFHGMTLRDYFAAKAMAAYIQVAGAWRSADFERHSIDAYAQADAMLAAREVK